MIIIKIIIVYFVQIRHTDDFPSTGIPASMIINADVITIASPGIGCNQIRGLTSSAICFTSHKRTTGPAC